MKKIYQYTTLVLCLLTQFLFSQFENNAIKNKNILIVYGGWLDHQPEIFAGKIANWLETQQANVTLSKSTGIYLDKTVMSKTDLIIQHITMSSIKSSESKALQNAIANGTALAGCHGGLGDAFRNDTEFQYMIGGQFVKHPGGQVDYSVKAKKNLKTIADLGMDNLPICMAKTQKSFSDNEVLVGRPTGFTVNVREFEFAAGAGFVIPILGKMMRMPGLPAIPASENMFIDNEGKISGLS